MQTQIQVQSQYQFNSKTRNMPNVPSVTSMNKNFVIKWRNYGEPDNGKFNKLIGAGRYEEMFGEKYRDAHFVRAFDSLKKKTVFGIRGKFVITFIAK